MTFSIELEQESDGRWFGEISALPGVLAYGLSATDAIARVRALARRVLAHRIEHGEAVPANTSICLVTASTPEED
jgi:predicted RNase H-like HicB family nuclease